MLHRPPSPVRIKSKPVSKVSQVLSVFTSKKQRESEARLLESRKRVKSQCLFEPILDEIKRARGQSRHEDFFMRRLQEHISAGPANLHQSRRKPVFGSFLEQDFRSRNNGLSRGREGAREKDPYSFWQEKTRLIRTEGRGPREERGASLLEASRASKGILEYLREQEEVESRHSRHSQACDREDKVGHTAPARGRKQAQTMDHLHLEDDDLLAV
jgi:hypothetical protein